MKRSFLSFSKLLALSYVLDWALLIAFAVGGAVFSIVSPKKRSFSLVNPSISYPYGPDTISITTVGLVAIVVPAIIIAAVCLLAVQRNGFEDSRTRHSLVWRRRLWEWFTGWLGLGISIVLSFFLTQSMKNLFGKQRPDFLARCNPDMTRAAQFVVGGYGHSARDVGTLVNWQICQSKDGSGVGLSEFEDGFRSFPSGHCTIAFAGLLYLSLFLAGKFSVGIPSSSVISSRSGASNQGSTKPGPRSNVLVKATSSRSDIARKQAAAPPIYLITLILIPIGAAIYIASTRYADYKHHGFDVLFSSIEGALCAWFGFRLYHLPVHRAAGWSWGPRSRDKAFGIGIGAAGYIDTESGVDLENGVLTEQNIGRAPQEGNNRGGNSIEMDNLRCHRSVGSSSSQRPLRQE